MACSGTVASMKVELSAGTGVPIYAQIVDQIRRQVATGQLQPGEQLPTVRQLAVDLTVNPNTVARAYTELEREGVIVTQQGRGTFATEHPADDRLQELRRDRLRNLISSALLEALSSGHSPKEIEEVFEEQMVRWQKRLSNGGEQ